MWSSHKAGEPDVAMVEALEARIDALPGLSVAELRQAWTEAWGSPPPKGIRRRLLTPGIAWQWQAELYGGLSRSAERRLAQVEADYRQSTPAIPSRRPVSEANLRPGSRLIRVWKTERHEIEVAEIGYL